MWVAIQESLSYMVTPILQPRFARRSGMAGGKGKPMSEATLKARIVRVYFEEGRTGLIYATSPELTGFAVARETMEALEIAIPQAIKEMYASCGVDVYVSKLEQDDCLDDNSWVAFPAEIAKADMDASSTTS
jgi:hypothetical protein